MAEMGERQGILFLATSLEETDHPLQCREYAQEPLEGGIRVL